MGLLAINQLQFVMTNSQARALRFIEPLNRTLAEFGIDTPTRVAMFLAQIAEESGELRYTRELWSPTPSQERYERDFGQPWTKDDPRNRVAFMLGNSEHGDGYKYLGRGLIQTTGRTNYQRTSTALCGSATHLLDHPEELEAVDGACRSAGYFWQWKNLNQFADADDLIACTRRVNGGLTHYDRRHQYWTRARETLGCS